MAGNFKFYVVGESSGDPETWCEWGGWCLVLAETPEQATTLVGDRVDTRHVAEVQARAPAFICHHDVRGVC